MIAVVDTSALVTLFAGNQDSLDPRLAARLAQVTVPHEPDIIDVEFHHAVRGLLLDRKIHEGRANLARRLFAQAPKKRLAHLLSERIWSLRNNLGAYDACFVALAEALDAPLITCDDKLRTASGHSANVEVFDPSDWKSL